MVFSDASFTESDNLEFDGLHLCMHSTSDDNADEAAEAASLKHRLPGDTFPYATYAVLEYIGNACPVAPSVRLLCDK